MPEFKRGIFEDMFDAAYVCRQRGLNIPMLALPYTTLDALAWSVYASLQKKYDVRGNFVKTCDSFLFPNPKITCTSLELYAARCGILHNLGWESDISRNKQARVVIYSFGSDVSKFAQEAPNVIPTALGKFVHLHADDLYLAIALTWWRIMDATRSDPKLAARLIASTDKQYRSLDPKSTDILFEKFIALQRKFNGST